MYSVSPGKSQAWQFFVGIMQIDVNAEIAGISQDQR